MSLTSREAIILSILKGQEKYGTQIRDEYRKRTKRIFPIGSLYTTLGRMFEKKLIKQHAQKGPRKYYSSTNAGRRKLKSLQNSCKADGKAV